MKDKIKKGDTVSIIEHPHIKSKVELITKGTFSDITFYVLENGCWYQKNEIKKEES